MDKKKAIFCWSGGKDSALALYKVLQQGRYDVVALLTTINEEYKRVSMHGVREELLEEQSKQIGIPLEKIYVTKNSTNEEYEKNMGAALQKYKNLGVYKVIFGDIFLEDLKTYRENNLAKIGMTAIFPLWKQDTRKLISEFISLDFKTILCCTNNDFFDEHAVGKVIDKRFVSSLSLEIDPCGENGEFHTFTFEGPIFKFPIRLKKGEKVMKTYEARCMKDDKETTEVKGYWFIDLELRGS